MTTCQTCSDTHKTLESFVHGETEKEYMVPCEDCPRCAHCVRRISDNVTVPLRDFGSGKLWCDADEIAGWLALRVHVDLTPVDALYIVLRVRDEYKAAPETDAKHHRKTTIALDDLVLWVLRAITIEERAQKSIERGRKG